MSLAPCRPCPSYSFYGNPAERSTVRDLKQRKKLRLKALALSTGEPLRDPEDFVAQQQTALDKARELGVCCFAEEVTDDGKRRFIAGTPLQMWRLISMRKRAERHFYEIIRQGEMCKLYFDIEYSLVENPDSKGKIRERALRKFVKVVRNKIQDTFGRRISSRNVMDLDSSTDVKFSRHVIIDIPGSIFRDNFFVGNFVRHVCNNLSPEDSDRCSFLKDGEKKLFVDLGVYTKNRNFRLFLNSKHGKKAVLKLTDRCEENNFGQVRENVFLQSLIAYIPDAAERETLTFGAILPAAPRRYATGGDENSLFPEIDEFIRSKIEPTEQPGKIRKINWIPTVNTLEYEISGYRYCGRIKRCHKSNCIKYVVLLKSGIYFQVCHDPDCRGFKSEDLFLPDESQPWKDWKVEDFE